MKQKEKDIKNISTQLEFFKKTCKTLDEFNEQDKDNTYMLVCVEKVVDKDGKKRNLSHVAVSGNHEVLSGAFYEAMLEDEFFCEAVLTAGLRYYLSKKHKEGKK